MSTKPGREVSGDDSPGHIRADLLANSLGVSRPPPISDRTYTLTKPIGKSQEVNLLAVFDTDLSAIALEFQDPADHRSDLYIDKTHREVSGNKFPGHIWHGLIGNSLRVLSSRPSMTMDLNKKN
jgi:hypothetical protein